MYTYLLSNLFKYVLGSLGGTLRCVSVTQFCAIILGIETLCCIILA